MYIVNHLLTQYNQTDAVSVCVHVYVLLLLLTLCVPVMDILQVTHLLNNLEFIIIPFVNPDGYVVSKSLKEREGEGGTEGGRERFVHCFGISLQFTWSQDRLWRKNRHMVDSQKGLPHPCVGVDINRNFPLGWKSVWNFIFLCMCT